MGTHQDALQRTEIGLITVMGTLSDSTFNALVCVTVHSRFLLFL